MGTFNSTGSGGNWTDDSTWAETGQPAADGNDHVIITSGDTVTLTGNVGTGSLRVNGTLEGNYTVTLNDGGQSAILHNNGTINDTPNFTITGGTNREIKNDSSSTLGTVTINSSGQTFTLAGPNTHTYEALTITAGTLTTLDGSTSRNLTVTGDTTIDGGTLTCNASTINLRSGGSGSTWGLRVNSGTFTGGTGTHNIGGIRVQGGTFVWSNGTTTLNGGETSSSASTLYKTSSGTFTVGTGTVVVDTSSTLQWLLYGGDISVYNLTIASGSTLRLWQNTSDGSGARLLTVAGDLTVTGTLNTKFGSQDDVNLTVTGDCTVDGTLTGNASAITIGKMLEIKNTGIYNETSGTTLISGQPDGDYVLRNHDGGTYTKHATGILKIARTSASGTKYAKFGEDVYNDVKLENTSSGSVVAIVGVMNLAGDLTVVEGELRSYGGTGAIDIGSHVSIENGGKFSTETSQLTAGGVNASFGSLTIASGGTYDATPLTTTITNENSSGFAIQNSGTFTHNNGLVDIDLDTPTTTQASNGPYYDFTQSDAATDFYPAEAFEVMNNLSFVGDFEFQNNAHHLTVHGNMTIGNGSTTTRYMPYHTRTCNLTVGGILEVTTGATLTNFSHGTINVGGVRNTGGTM